MDSESQLPIGMWRMLAGIVLFVAVSPSAFAKQTQILPFFLHSLPSFTSLQADSIPKIRSANIFLNRKLWTNQSLNLGRPDYKAQNVSFLRSIALQVMYQWIGLLLYTY
jgi:hypothetical protein